MKNINSILLSMLFLTCFSLTNSNAVLPLLWRGCGTSCGQAQLQVNKPSQIDYVFTAFESAGVPSTVNVSGTYYYRIKIGASTFYNYSKSYTLSNVPVTAIGGGLKMMTFNMTAAFSPDPLGVVLNASPASYDLYIAHYFTLTNGPYTLMKTIGNLGTPITTDLAGTTYPIVVTQSLVQNSNSPSNITVDGYELNPSMTTNMYTCKTTWPFRIDFPSITDCRSYTVKIDYGDVTVGGCGSSPAYIPDVPQSASLLAAHRSGGCAP